jgi:hypothetical protein
LRLLLFLLHHWYCSYFLIIFFPSPNSSMVPVYSRQ